MANWASDALPPADDDATAYDDDAIPAAVSYTHLTLPTTD